MHRVGTFNISEATGTENKTKQNKTPKNKTKNNKHNLPKKPRNYTKHIEQ